MIRLFKGHLQDRLKQVVVVEKFTNYNETCAIQIIYYTQYYQKSFIEFQSPE